MEASGRVTFDDSVPRKMSLCCLGFFFGVFACVCARGGRVVCSPWTYDSTCRSRTHCLHGLCIHICTTCWKRNYHINTISDGERKNRNLFLLQWSRHATCDNMFQPNSFLKSFSVSDMFAKQADSHDRATAENHIRLAMLGQK